MDGILPRVPWRVKESICRRLRNTTNAGEYRRCLIIINLLNERCVAKTAEIVGVARGTVYRVVERFEELGEAGLLDQREDNGHMKLDEHYLSALDRVVRSNPEEHGWRRPTWTREMLVETMRKKTGVTIHVATMSRGLQQIHARRGSPRPIVKCPWSDRARKRRVSMIRRLTETLPRGHVAVYEDEVDIHLNPKIGLDWMGRGQQKEVVTPGQNRKRYIAGAMDARTGRLTWVEGEKKDSMHFIRLIHALRRSYPRTKVIHVILDNCRVHASRITQAALRELRGRVVLHFLPPYCPNDNKIERLWQDLHAEVTRNHRRPDMTSLMRDVRRFLKARGTDAKRRYLRAAA